MLEFYPSFHRDFLNSLKSQDPTDQEEEARFLAQSIDT